jgi:leucyl aminopeptidase (aminopeptidase T)
MEIGSALASRTALAAANHLVTACGSLRAGERAVVVVDPTTHEIGELVAARCRPLAGEVVLRSIPTAAMHGTEPPADVAAEMRRADVIFGLTHFSMAHTAARRAACEAGARYLSLPEYSLALLENPAVTVDYRARAPVVRAVADAFTAGSSVHITTPHGTDIRLDITGRTGNYCPGFVERPGELGSPPDIEANVSPVETASEGVVVVDGSIPCAEIGLLREPVTLEVRGGRIVRFRSADTQVVAVLERLFEAVGSDRAYVLAECGVGLNEAAQLSGVMLTDEGAAGCLHFGFGSNATVGGLNDVPFHLDFVYRAGTLRVDGHTLIDDGAVLV